MCVCTYIYIYIYIYIHTHTHICTYTMCVHIPCTLLHTYTHTFMHTDSTGKTHRPKACHVTYVECQVCMCVCIRVCICLCMCVSLSTLPTFSVCAHALNTYIITAHIRYIQLRRQEHAQMLTYIRAYTYVHIYILVHTYIHTYIHTYLQGFPGSERRPRRVYRRRHS